MKTFSQWTSDSGRTLITAKLIPETDQEFFPGKRMIIHIKHNYGDYMFDGEIRSNVGEERRYSKSNRLSYGIAWGKQYFKNHF